MTASPQHGGSTRFDDVHKQVRDLNERIAQARLEASRASAVRRRQIGWWIFGAIKHLDRLANVSMARELGEHRFIVHEIDSGQVWAICSCGARFRGQMHVDFSAAQFASLRGHER